MPQEGYFEKKMECSLDDDDHDIRWGIHAPVLFTIINICIFLTCTLCRMKSKRCAWREESKSVLILKSIYLSSCRVVTFHVCYDDDGHDHGMAVKAKLEWKERELKDKSSQQQ